MKFSWNWLCEFVDLDGISPAEVASRFTLTVAELEGVLPVGHGLEGVVVGRIAALAPHPNADKLRVVDLDLGGRTVRGVSGAPNLVDGMLVPVALPGTMLPGGEVRGAEIRGVASEAVLLSEKELGLSDDHSGVLAIGPDDVLPRWRPEGAGWGATLPAGLLGASLPTVLPVADTVFEVDNKSITHRPDLWGHHGMAREIAAMTGRRLSALPGLDALPADLRPTDDDPLAVSVDDAADCPRYLALCYTGVVPAPSPFPIRQRLRAVGMRPISNVVDLTNYIMLAVGEPMHAFDRRQIGGDAIRVRRAGEGEAFRTLDGADHVLSAEDLLIADGNRGVALAGVMGGENSEIAADTSDVVLECATFHPGRVRRTALRHGLRTESSARFEKSLDPHLPPLAMAMFTTMLARLSPGARPSSRVYDVAGPRRAPVVVRLDPAYVSRRLGIEVPASRSREILEHLGFTVGERGDGAWDVTVPSWRATRDVSLPEDLLEEVGRVVGYDRIVPQPPMAAVTLVPRRPRADRIRAIQGILAGECGLDEVMTYSFDSRAMLDRLGFEPADTLRLRNPLTADQVTLRTELAPSMLGVLERNAGRFADFGAFEVARVFRGTHDADGVPVQGYRLGIVLYRRGAKTPDEVSALFRRAKGVLEHLLGRLGLGDVAVRDPWAGDSRPWMHPRATVAVQAAGQAIGWMTRVHPGTLGTLSVTGASVLAELDVEALTALPGAARRFQPVARFPSMQADLSLIVDQRALAGTFEAALRRTAGEHLASLELVSVYQGDPIPAGHKSLTFRLTFQASDRTLSDAEVKAALDRATAEVKAAGATLWGL